MRLSGDRAAAERARVYLRRLWDDAEADYRRQILTRVADTAPEKLLDLGCHDGVWTRAVADASGPQLCEVCGVEVVAAAR